MKKLFSLLLVLSSLNVFAMQAANKTTVPAAKNNYMISANLYINDKKINTATFGVTEGEKGSIEMLENYIEVTSIKPDTTNSKDGVRMSFTVGSFNEKGEKTVVATPTVTTNENKMATLVFTSKTGEDTYKIEMTSTKVTK
jgi:hypothetical protein